MSIAPVQKSRLVDVVNDGRSKPYTSLAVPVCEAQAEERLVGTTKREVSVSKKVLAVPRKHSE